MALAPAAGINPYIIENGRRYFLIGKEISTQRWSGFTGGYEDKDQDVEHTAVRELIEESCNVFLSWKDVLIENLHNHVNCNLIKSKTPRGRDLFVWFVEFPPDIKNQKLEEEFQKNRTKTFDIHYLEKHGIKWVEEAEIFNENLSRGYRKDLKTFLNFKNVQKRSQKQPSNQW